MQWLRNENKNNDIVVEAPGWMASNEINARAAEYAFAPLVLGSVANECVMRMYKDINSNVAKPIDKLYETTDIELTKAIIKKYHITYIIIGINEKLKYAPAGLEKFNKLFSKEIENEDIRIYKTEL